LDGKPRKAKRQKAANPDSTLVRLPRPQLGKGRRRREKDDPIVGIEVSFSADGKDFVLWATSRKGEMASYLSLAAIVQEGGIALSPATEKAIGDAKKRLVRHKAKQAERELS